MSNALEIVSVINTLLTLVRESQLSLGPVLEKIRVAQAEGRDVTNADLDEAAAETDRLKQAVRDQISLL